MRALAVSERGAAPAVIDVPEPELTDGGVRVAVEAASLNGFDTAVAAGYVWDRMPHTFPVVLGRDFAGTVGAVGPGVEPGLVGQRVAGNIQAHGLGRGAIAESVAQAAGSVTSIPDRVSAVQAAAVGLAGVTALDLVDVLDISADDLVLVAGATGGVGAYAVQLATMRGARVIATARQGAAQDFARSLGASEVIDYTGDVVSEARAVAGRITKAVHAAGDPTALAAVLSAGGRLASVLGATAEQVGRDDITVTPVMAGYTPEKLAGLLRLVADGRLTVPVAQTFPLAEAASALTAFSAPKLGKIVVTVP